MQTLDLPVELRTKLGSSQARRHRRAGEIPCILYGRGQDPVALTTSAEAFEEIQKAHTALVQLKLGDETQLALLREIVWDTFGNHVQHIDFARVEPEDTVRIRVPILYLGNPAGASVGGSLHAVMNDIQLMSRVDSIPTELRVDVSSMQIGDMVRTGELDLPEHVSPAGNSRELLCQVKPPKKVEEETPVEGEEVAAAPEPAPQA